MAAVNTTGFGLTFGTHSRIDETVRYIHRHLRVGNAYLNRSMAGSVVGVQPFGGEGLSGTGPQEATMSDTGAPGASRAPNGVARSRFGRGRQGMLNPRPFRSLPIVASLGNTQPVAPRPSDKGHGHGEKRCRLGSAWFPG